ncbi:MAG: IS3 family transposase, partial [Fibrobacter sp.]|nr:IS3 family transposase [Fibrobacter sp.]
NEFFYSRNWGKVDKEEFKVELEKYLEWFCTKRIKVRLNGMSPMDYRKLYLDKQPV